MKKLVAFVLAAISLISPCLIVLGYVTQQYRTSKAAPVSNEGSKKLPIYCVDTKGEKKVAITFDAAWGDEDAEKIRSILNQYEVKATFFMVGDWIRKYPELVKTLAADGHDMANHSNKHPHVCQMGKEEIMQDIIACNEEIKQVTGETCWLYRPPYGEYNNTVLEAAKACGCETIQWDVDSLDWKGYDAATLVHKVLDHKHLGDGTIILLHNGAKHTAEALPQIIEGLKEKGFQIVPISKLIYKSDYKLDHEGRQHEITAP